MPLSVGAKLCPYEILAPLGPGDMGEVWEASDYERKRRFVQKAKTASALNHPNIVTIYEIALVGSLVVQLSYRLTCRVQRLNSMCVPYGHVEDVRETSLRRLRSPSVRRRRIAADARGIDIDQSLKQACGPDDSKVDPIK
jgi:serine/threonine protein kinase